jgi:hypothetical protein
MRRPRTYIRERSVARASPYATSETSTTSIVRCVHTQPFAIATRSLADAHTSGTCSAGGAVRNPLRASCGLTVGGCAVPLSSPSAPVIRWHVSRRSGSVARARGINLGGSRASQHASWQLRLIVRENGLTSGYVCGTRTVHAREWMAPRARLHARRGNITRRGHVYTTTAIGVAKGGRQQPTQRHRIGRICEERQP